MSEQNVEIVRKAIEAGNRRDLVMERALHAFTQADSDVVVPNIAHMRGRDGMG